MCVCKIECVRVCVCVSLCVLELVVVVLYLPRSLQEVAAVLISLRDHVEHLLYHHLLLVLLLVGNS